jgi:hypothetical protein
MSRKDYTYRILDILLVVIILFIYGGYKHYKKGSVYHLDSKGITSASDNSWKTYQNNTLGYVFKYPSYMPVQADTEIPFDKFGQGPLNLSISFGFEQKEQYENYDKLAKDLVKNTSNSKDFNCIKEQSLESSSQPYDFMVCTGKGGPYGLRAVIRGADRTAFIDAGGQCGLTAEFTRNSGCLKNLEDIRAFLGSFKFITPGDEYNLATWNQYTGKEYTFKYPKDWPVKETSSGVEIAHDSNIISVITYTIPNGADPLRFLQEQKIIPYYPTIIHGDYTKTNPARLDFNEEQFGIFSQNPTKFYAVKITDEKHADPTGHPVFELLLTSFVPN